MVWLWFASALANTGSMDVKGSASTSPEGIQVVATRVGEDVILKVDVPCGLHAYGHKEQLGLPLAVFVDDQEIRAIVPPGVRTVTHPELPPSYWLEDTVRVRATTRATFGELRVQACSANTCYPPERLPWSLPLPESPRPRLDLPHEPIVP
ncbi:MAG: hypothetical protein AAF211_20025 [Myxococcota bacterium]